MRRKRMKHISIVGSCVLRDVFNSKFVPGWSDEFVVDSYFARTTIPSITSGPLTYDLELLEQKFSALKFEYHYTECAKCMLQILENNASDYLLLDFYADAYYGTYLYQNNYYGGWSFGRLLGKHIIKTDDQYKLYNFFNDPTDYFEIWCEAFDKFMRYHDAYFPHTKLIINGIKGSNQITKNGEIISIQQPDVDIEQLNSLWHKFDDYVAEKYRIPVVKYEQKYTLDPDYIYGLNNEFVHFHKEYYTDCFSKLKGLCTEKTEPLTGTMKNLVRNYNFLEGLKFWSFSNCDWKIISENARCWIVPRNKRGAAWRSIWSDPIEINGDGEKEYEVSVSIKLQGECSEENVPILGYRTFKKAVSKKNSESIESELFYVDMNGKNTDTEYQCAFSFKPKGKFIRIAPHHKNGMNTVLFTNIQLKRKL